MLVGRRRKEQHLPRGAFLKATQRASGGARIRAEPLLAPCPQHDSELVSKARELVEVSFVYLDSSVLCFPFKALEPHGDSERRQEPACGLVSGASQRSACELSVLPCRQAKELKWL